MDAITKLAINRIKKQRKKLLMEHGSIGSVLIGLDLRLDRNKPTMATDGFSLMFNPDFINKIKDDEIMAVLVHEAYHVYAGHPLRISKIAERDGGVDSKSANIAADAAINWQIDKDGFKLPGEPVRMDEAIERLSFERIYAKLTHAKQSDQQEQDQSSDSCSAVGGSTNGCEEGSEQQETSESGEEEKEKGKTGNCEGQKEQEEQQGEGGEDDSSEGDSERDDGGSDDGQGKEEESWEDMFTGDPDSGGGVEACETATIEEAEEKHMDTVNVSSAFSGIGDSFSAPMKVEAQEVAVETPEWKDQLAEEFAGNFGDISGVDISRYDRKYIGMDLWINPEDRQENRSIVIAVDVSTSIDQQTANEFMQHAKDLFEGSEIESVDLLTFNAGIASHKKLERGDEFPKVFARGGGTAFDPIFYWIRENKQPGDISAVLIFTDMFGRVTFKDCDLDYPVIWMSQSTSKVLDYYRELLEKYGVLDVGRIITIE